LNNAHLDAKQSMNHVLNIAHLEIFKTWFIDCLASKWAIFPVVGLTKVLSLLCQYLR
jgi:hypothetical protein